MLHLEEGDHPYFPSFLYVALAREGLAVQTQDLCHVQEPFTSLGTGGQGVLCEKLHKEKSFLLYLDASM